MNAEPQLEELSAYLDQELSGTARQQLEAHLSGCETCRRRLDALKETVHAVRALPMETPSRTFTIPAQRKQARRWGWEPMAWVGGLAAAALLVVIVGSSLHGPGGAATTAGSTSLAQSREHAVAEPATKSQGSPAFDQGAFAAPLWPLANRASTVDPSHPSRRLTLATDSSSYTADGTLTVHLAIQGVPYSTPQTSTSAGLRVVLVRAGAGVELYPGETSQSSSLVTFTDSYAIRQVGLSEPVAGSYRLIAIWRIPDGNGTTLEAEVPIQITSS